MLVLLASVSLTGVLLGLLMLWVSRYYKTTRLQKTLKEYRPQDREAPAYSHIEGNTDDGNRTTYENSNTSRNYFSSEDECHSSSKDTKIDPLLLSDTSEDEEDHKFLRADLHSFSI